MDSAPTAPRHGPLAGLRVLAIENYLAGNHTTFLLGLFGAEIIKIEQPGVGDALRGSAGQVGHLDNKQQNKKSLAIDLRNPEGRSIFLDLVAHADVVFTNQKPSSLERLGISYEALCTSNPKIIYTTLSGFGHDDLTPAGPFGAWPAFDVIAQGVAGLMFRCLGPDADTPGYNGIPLGDDGTAIFAALGTVLAVLARDRTGDAQRVDAAMHDAMVYFNGGSINRWRLQGTEASRGRSTGGSAPYGPYRTADGWVNIAVWGDGLWKRFCVAIGRAELADDARFLTAPLRLQNLGVLDEEVVLRFTSTRTTNIVMAALHAHGVPVAPVFTTEQVVESAQVEARKLFLDVIDADGTLRAKAVLGSPVKLSSLDDAPLEPPPALGQHTAELLSQLLGLDDIDIADLVARGAVEVGSSAIQEAR